MSPIGRVFIVLNLLLAGTFVGFAGTYLQQANHWKDLHGKKEQDLAKLQQEFSAFRKNSDDQINKQQNEEIAREFGIVWRVFKRDPLRPLSLYFRNYALTGLGFFT